MIRRADVEAVRAQPQVFLSFAYGDRELARDISAKLAAAGVDVVQMDTLEPGGQYTDNVRGALHDSNAVVVVLSDVSRRREFPASVLFEIGAAAGADKPIFVIVEDMTAKLPFNISHLHVLPVNRVEEIAQRLRRED